MQDAPPARSPRSEACFKPLDIGEAARRVGVSAAALRMYEKRGLLPEALRSPGGYRQYAEEHLQRARLVRRARRMGLSLAQIAQAMGRDGERACLQRLLRAHVERLEREARRLARVQRHLKRWLDDTAR